MGCLTLSTKRVDALHLHAKRVDALHLTCVLVCDAGRGVAKYLRVKPEEVQWVYPTIETYYDVESNTTWNVE